MKKSLAGKTIVVTRSTEQADEMIARLKQAGADVLHIPTIEAAAPDSWDACDAAIDRLQTYDWIVFSSTNGVRFFSQRLQQRGRSVSDLNSLKIAAVGERTQSALSDLGLTVDLVPEDEYSAEGLSRAFQAEQVRGKRVLLAKAQKSRRVLEAYLQEAGAQVEVVAVYQTRACRTQGQDRLNGHIDCLTFTSPSTFINFLSEFGEKRLAAWKENGCAIAAIGNVTAAAISKADFEVEIIPEQSTIPELLNAIEEYYR